VRLPEAAEGVEPFVGGGQLRGLDRVEAAGALGLHGREAGLPQHPQVLRHRGLRDPELRLDDAGDSTSVIDGFWFGLSKRSWQFN